jgi:hydroxymethylbilane synthase
VELVPITTAGDADRTRPIDRLGERGVFAKAVQTAVLEDRADLAVHSYKDLPTEPTPDLVVAAVPPRADARDALVAGRYGSLADLPRAARVGTGSTRRAAQLARVRPDLRVVPLRGSVGTRVAKVRDGDIEATVMAVAGLQRAGLGDAISVILEPPEFLPAPAQGALAVEVAAARSDLVDLVGAIDDRVARVTSAAERAFLHELQGGCSLPAGALATVEGDRLRLQAGVFGSGEAVPVVVTGALDEAEALGRQAGARVLAAAPSS